MYSLQCKIYEEIEKADVVSFDIFDTLLLRPYIKPTDLFVHMEKFFNAPGFAENRIQSEITARQNTGKPEVTIDDIYLFVDNRYQALKSKEIDFEKQILQPNNEMKKVYDRALSCGKKIIITSDMYLPQDVIESILKKNDYINYSKLYLSSSVQKTKSQGNLYDLIKEEIETNNILHIGDNYNSDYVKAKEHGLCAIHYEKPISKFINSSKRVAKFVKSHSNDLFASILIGSLSIYKQNNDCDNYWENIGFDYAGPAIYTYTSWLDKQFEKDNIHDALFVARDGYSLQKVYEIIKTSNKTKSYYLYAPRILNLICNLDLNAQLAYGGAYAAATVSTVINYFKTAKCFHNLHIPEQSDPDQQINFVKSHLQEYKNLAKQEKERYMSYLKNQNLSVNSKIALVDTMSYFLSSQKFLESMLNKKIKGYYWIIWENADISNYNVSTLQYERKSLFRDWNLMEFFMTAPTPPIHNVIDNKPQFKPVLPYEQVRIDAYSYVSEGAIEFAKTIKNIFIDINVYSDYKTLTDWINSFIDMPTNEDKKHFIKIKHAYDANHTQFIPLCKPWYKNKYEIIKRYHLFKFIPIITEQQKSIADTKKYVLFNILTLLKKKRKGHYLKYYILGIFPVFWHKI